MRNIFSKRTTFLVNQFRYSNQCHFANLIYAVNPEGFGFEPESSSWKDSGWHRNLIGEEPRRKELVAAVTEVGRKLNNAVKRGFDGKLDGWTSDIALKFD